MLMLGCSEHAVFEAGAITHQHTVRRRRARFDASGGLSLIEKYTDQVFPPPRSGVKTFLGQELNTAARHKFRFAQLHRENDAEIPVDGKHGPWRFDLLGPVGPPCTNAETYVQAAAGLEPTSGTL